MKRLKRLLRRKRKNSGFTLVELVISCALLGILVVGVTAFIGPVLQSAASNEKNVRATLLTQTIDEYVNRCIRDSYYVAIFTNASRDMAEDGGAIANNENIAAMKAFVDQNNDIYELKCFSFSWAEDTYSHENKYMLMSETFQNATTALLTSSTGDITEKKPTSVFEYCMYDGLFPEFQVEQLKGKADASSDSVSESDTSGSEVPVAATKTTYTVYTKQEMETPDFIGIGYTDFVNVRARSESNKTLKFQFYPITDMGVTEGHPSTFIYYVARKPTIFNVTLP